MITKEFLIKNPTGLHARPATDLCAICKSFSSKITLVCGPKTINPRSVVSILMGEMTAGKTVRVTIDGEDEQAAMERLTAFLENLKE